MAEQDAPPPPPLPPRLADPVPAIVAGTALWLVAFVAVLLFDRDDTTLLLTCLSGSVLGIIGYGVFSWQRRAARSGSRTAQRGLD